MTWGWAREGTTMAGEVDLGGEVLLTVKISNTRPVDLVDLTTSLMALAEEFRDFASRENEPAEIKLYVRELRSGSVIADLIPIAQQADWVLDHKDILGAFVGNLSDLVEFFLRGKGNESGATKMPSREEAKRLSQILDPVAKDGGAQFNIQLSDHAKIEFHTHIHVDSIDANAIQNGVRRFLGPDLPAQLVRRDQLMVLEQVKNSTSSKTGDRAIIEAVWPKPVRLQFLSDEAKAKVLTLEENPFQKVFVVDVEVHSVGGKPVLYRVIDVKDALERP